MKTQFGKGRLKMPTLEEIRARRREYAEEHYGKYPWLKTLRRIQGRCLHTQPYAKQGIKNLLTAEDLKMMWFRDGADKMKKPSIDRIDPKGNYTFGNCRYMELSENCSVGSKNGWAKRFAGKISLEDVLAGWDANKTIKDNCAALRISYKRGKDICLRKELKYKRLFGDTGGK